MTSSLFATALVAAGSSPTLLLGAPIHIGRPDGSGPGRCTERGAVLSADAGPRPTSYAGQVLLGALRSFWQAERVTPPAATPGKALVIGAIAMAAVVETVVRDDLIWPAASLGVLLVALPALWVRRAHPGPAMAAVFGVVVLVDLVALARGVSWEGLNTMVVLLALPFALFRWGSGREALTVVWLMYLAATLGALDETGETADAIGGFVIVTLTIGAGLLVRFAEEARGQRQERARAEEREQLARELHDTVAHHVSAIAVQAQAGRALADRRPEAAVEALEVIEDAASRTLEEMRALVRALRRGDEDVDLDPGRRIAHLGELAAVAGTLELDLVVEGRADQLRPSVQAAVYRLAQESITNAARHADGASSVSVRVVVDAETVSVVVADDGRPAIVSDDRGYGLIGMRERVELLGGDFSAGPGPIGWRVEAELPRRGNVA